MKKIAKIVLAALMLVVSQVGAHAAPAGPFTVGASTGLSFPSDNLETRWAYGLNGSYALSDSFRAGLGLLYSKANVGGISFAGFTLGGFPVKLLNVHAEALYTAEGFFAGAKLGVTSLSSDLPTLPSKTSFSAGPVVGYDFSVSNEMTVGPSAEYIHVFAKDSYSMVNVLANLKYHF